MIILGLGSNLGDRLNNLKLALSSIKKITNVSVKQVSPVYISDALLPDDAPSEWNLPFLNLAIAINTTLEPLQLLKQLKLTEQQIGRTPEGKRWGPRIIDIDILAWNDLILNTDSLSIPHKRLEERPFALWPLADIAPLWQYQGKTAAERVEQWGSRFSGEAPLHTRQIYQRIDTPALVGTINVTPDSFSDGGLFLNPDKAVEQAILLVASGADIIDIGAESTAPNAIPVTPQQEWERLEPVLMAINHAKSQFLLPPKISIDTRHADVAAKALNLGVDWINDVTGLQDPRMREIVASSSADCVMMHHLSIPPSRLHVLPRDQDAVKLVYAWGEKHLEVLSQAGIASSRVIFDPGIGFGKTPEHNVLLLKQAEVFKQLGVRVLIGHSRKSFMSLLTPYLAKDRDIETLTISFALAKQEIDYLRIHNVEMCARGFKTAAAL